MENKMKRAAEIVWKKCINITENEKAMIISDGNAPEVSNMLLEIGKKLCNCSLYEMKKREISGQEPPKEITEKMLQNNVIIASTSKSLTHTEAVRNAFKNGARIVSMPRITKEMFQRAIPIDYEKMKQYNERLIEKLNGSEIIIETKQGTDLYLVMKGRRIHNCFGVFLGKSGITNLPDGEVCFSPLEKKSEGKIIIDLSAAPDYETKFGRIGLVKKPFRITVENGHMVDCENPVLWKWATSVENGTNLAELGIGTNPKAKITGNILEDEKVTGTAHIAFGSNKTLGGSIQSEIQLDSVFNKPIITIDRRIIIEEGKLL